jgi:tetratricopeptide (TPR) repeat protein
MSLSAVEKIERGARRLSDVGQVDRFAHVLGTTRDVLLGDQSEWGRAAPMSDAELGRRVFLRGMGVVGGGELLDRIAYGPPPGRVGKADVEAYREATVHLAGLYVRTGASGLRGAARGHLSELVRAARSATRQGLKRQCWSLAGETAALAGWMAQDGGDNDEALAWYETGLAAAEEANDKAVAAYLLASATVLPQYRVHSPVDVVEALNGEARGVRMADANPDVQAWAATLRAGAHSKMGHRDEALRALREAEAVIEQPPDGRGPITVQFSPARLQGEYGIVGLRVGGMRPDWVEERLRQALADLDQADKVQSRYLTALARSRAAAGDVDKACQLALRSLKLGSEVVRSVGQLRALRAGPLSRYSDHPGVRDLDERLAATGR